MAKKGFKKKKEFQRFCQMMVRSGKIVDADGKWTPRSQSLASETIRRMFFCGRRVF